MIELYRGDSKTIKVQVLSKITPTDPGLPFDLTGYTARLTIKRNENDADFQLQKSVTDIDSPELGLVVFELKPSDTADLSGSGVYDIEIRNEIDAEHVKVYTVKKDSVRVIKDITTN